MRIAVICFLLGWALCAFFMLSVAFLFAWMVVVALAVTVEIVHYKVVSQMHGDIAFWLIFGAMMPILQEILGL